MGVRWPQLVVGEVSATTLNQEKARPIAVADSILKQTIAFPGLSSIPIFILKPMPLLLLKLPQTEPTPIKLTPIKIMPIEPTPTFLAELMLFSLPKLMPLLPIEPAPVPRTVPPTLPAVYFVVVVNHT